jgi:hypothetical protein
MPVRRQGVVRLVRSCGKGDVLPVDKDGAYLLPFTPARSSLSMGFNHREQHPEILA